jgi:hypothetical protein
MNDFKIVRYRGGEYPNCYNDGKQETYIEHVRVMEHRYNVQFTNIVKVVIGDNECPVTEIHFEDGLILYDEEFSVNKSNWQVKENENRIDKWLHKENINWCIVGSTKKPCWNCGKETYNVSSFESPMCSEECENVKYRGYLKTIEKYDECD